jgi:hypothetical protein
MLLGVVAILKRICDEAEETNKAAQEVQETGDHHAAPESAVGCEGVITVIPSSDDGRTQLKLPTLDSRGRHRDLAARFCFSPDHQQAAPWTVASI